MDTSLHQSASLTSMLPTGQCSLEHTHGASPVDFAECTTICAQECTYAQRFCIDLLLDALGAA